MSSPAAKRLPAVGTAIDEIAFAVEAGKVRELATAIKDPALRYRDAEAAAAEGFQGIPAPLTFTVVAGHHRDQHAAVRTLGLDIDRIVVGEVEWTYERPLVVGDRLVGRRVLLDARSRAGARGGEMTIVTLQTDLRDAAGDIAVRWREVLIETAGASA